MLARIFGVIKITPNFKPPAACFHTLSREKNRSPVTAVTTVTMFQTPPPLSKKPSQPSRSSRLGRFQRQADTSPGVAPAVLIADVVVYQQLPGPDV